MPPKVTNSEIIPSKTALSLNERLLKRHDLAQRQGRDWSHKLSEFEVGVGRLPTWCMIIVSLLRHGRPLDGVGGRADDVPPSIGPLISIFACRAVKDLSRL